MRCRAFLQETNVKLATDICGYVEGVIFLGCVVAAAAWMIRLF